MVDFMRFYGSSYCENYGSVMAGPLSLRASEVSLYGNYDTDIGQESAYTCKL